jgi:hypothetical protein
MLMCVAMTGCKKNKDNQVANGEVTITPTITPTVSPTPSEAASVDQTQEDTTENGTNTDTDYISKADAVKLIQDKIGERGYVVELIKENLSIEDNEYYVYEISDSSSVIEPSVLVDMVSGQLLCYYTDGSTAAFSEFPLYTETNDATSGSVAEEFTKEDALSKLSQLSAETLNLPVKIDEYTIVYDDWTTNVNGVECYGINAFTDVGESRTNMGVFYVAVDGSAMYRFDSLLDDFVEMVAE